MAKVYIEEIEDLSTHGVTQYSIVSGMDFYDAEVRASGVEITRRDKAELNEDEAAVLYDAMNKHLIKETKERYEETK